MKRLGHHLLIDIELAENLDNREIVERALRESVTAIGANLVAFHIKEFGKDAGLTAIAVLAESHMSIHTWPEYGRAALDVFVCGDLDPSACLSYLQNAFGGTLKTQIIER